MSMDKDLENLLRELQSSNTNIQIKIKHSDEVSSKTQREIAKLEKRIATLKEELFSLVFKVKERNSLVKSIRRRARLAKEKRDEWNKKASALKEKKNQLREELKDLLDRKYELLDQKRNKRAELDEEKDPAKRKQLYQELVSLKEKVGEVFDEIRIKRQELQDIQSSLGVAYQESRHHHVDMKAHYAYADQIKKEADEIYQEVKKKRKELRDLRDQLRGLKTPSKRKRVLRSQE